MTKTIKPPIRNRIQIQRGTKFGNLTFLSFAEPKTLPCGQRVRVASCVCSCSEMKEVLLVHLVRGKIKSCGKCIERRGGEDCVGKKYKYITITKHLKNVKVGTRSYRMVEVTCDCGVKKTMRLTKAKKAKSCGCRSHDAFKEKHRTHGESKTRLFGIWANMKSRCSNPNCKSFKNYGGRGISVCKEWFNSFEVFRDWALLNGYRSDLTLDRFPSNDGDYESYNCRWATYSQQAINKKRGVTQIIDTDVQSIIDNYRKRCTIIPQD